MKGFLKKNRNRIIYLLCLGAVLIFFSFYGGNVSYGLVFALGSVPVASIVYLVAVLFGLKIYQDIPVRQVVKGQLYQYELTVENELPIAIASLSLEFLSQLSTVADMKGEEVLHFEPMEKKTFVSKISCKYRGTYYVGLTRIIISDPFGLVTLRYSYKMKTRLTVKPRIVKLQDENVVAYEKDAKKSVNINDRQQEMLASDTKAYEKGDLINRIHWKNSAKAGELLVRRREPEYRESVCILMDSTALEADEETCIIYYDSIVERTLSLVDYFVRKGRRAEVILFLSGKYKLMEISSYEKIKELCDLLASYRFDLKYDRDRAERLAKSGSKAEKIYYIGGDL